MVQGQTGDPALAGADAAGADAPTPTHHTGEGRLPADPAVAGTVSRPPHADSTADRRTAASTVEAPDFERMLTANLLCFGRAVSKHFEARLADTGTGLTGAQARILLKLHHSGPVSQKSLAEITDVSAPTLARTLDVMERDGLVARTRNPADRREQLVTIADAGSSRLPALFSLFRDAESWLTAGLTGDDVTELLDQLSLLRDRLAGYFPCSRHDTEGTGAQPDAAAPASPVSTQGASR
ncbi:MAG: MarR family winged helix-turn-helix transcriptional regulator [Acidobacteriota bacterium]